jgi:O-antigen/teichoic acid export membrane protein
MGKNVLLSNTLKLTSGSILNYIIPILITPLLARLYSPLDYGEWGIFSGYVTILSVVVCGGYEAAIIRCHRKEDILNVFSLCLMINLCFNLFLLFFISLAELMDWTYVQAISGRWFIPFYLLLTGIIATGQNYANKIELYSILAVSQVLTGLVQAIARLALGFWGIEVNGLILGAIISLFICSLYLVCRINVTSQIKESFSINRISHLLIRFKKFPLFDSTSTLLIYASNHIPIIILAFYFPKEIVGCYTMVLQLLLMPMAFVGSNMGRVYYKEISGNENCISQLSLKVFQISFLLGIASILFFLLGGDFLLELFLGNKWEVAGNYALFLSIWALPTIMFAPLRPIYRTRNKQDLQMKVVLVSFLVQTLLLWGMVTCIKQIDLIICIYSICCALFRMIDGYIILKLSQFQLNKIETWRYIALLMIIFFWCLRVLSIIL